MTDPTRCVAIIPARGGSKGIAGKNLRPVGGVPLVARAIRAALAAPAVDLVVVTTDDDAIAAVAEAEGAEVVRRPDELASDVASSESALLHALDSLAGSGHHPDTCAFVQCTSPFIDPDDIDATAELVRSGGCDSAFTGTPNHGFVWRPGPNGMVGVNHDASVRQRRQDRPAELLETGAVYAFSVEGFRTAGHRFFGRIGAHEVPSSRALEIDEPADLALADAIARTRAASGPPAPDAALPERVDAIVFDFDGVMTDNRALVLQDGTEGVLVDRGDGAGVELLRGTGVAMLVITKETNPVALRRCEKLQLECRHDISDKWPVLAAWLAERSIDAAHVVYVGNDHNDVVCLERVGCGVAVADAHPSAVAVADLVLARPGGHGAVRELADLLIAHRLSPASRSGAGVAT